MERRARNVIAARGQRAGGLLRDHKPVVVLEPDHVAAGGLQAQLAEYGFEWIALVHDLADARRMVGAATVRLAILSLDQRPTEVLALALELSEAKVPLILTSASGGSLVLPGVQEPLTILPRGCTRETLVAAFDAQLGGERR